MFSVGQLGKLYITIPGDIVDGRKLADDEKRMRDAINATLKTVALLKDKPQQLKEYRKAFETLKCKYLLSQNSVDYGLMDAIQKIELAISD